MTREFKLSDIIKNQPIINVGCIGHVAHGKSTLVKALTGVVTPKHSTELERNITINLGYANLFIYFDEKENKIQYSNVEISNSTLVKHISFVDCPGHKALMSTMISGSKVMNAALLLVAGNDKIPQPQTVGHTEILKHTDISNILILLNKIDLYRKQEDISSSVDELKEFIGSAEILENQPIVPISAFKNINMDQIGRFLCNLPNHNMDTDKEFSMCILRSFDINYVNTPINDIQGGVIGGSIQSGYIEIGDHVMILPGLITKEKNKWVSKPIYSKVVTLFSDKRPLKIAFPGGLIAVGLDCDAALCKQNNFLGNVITKLTKKKRVVESDVSSIIKLRVEYLREMTDVGNIVLVINSRAIRGKITKRSKNKKDIEVSLDLPIVVVQDAQYPLLTQIKDTMELFAIGRLSNSTSNVKICLPNDLDTYYENVPEEIAEIRIMNDLPKINFETSSYNLDNIIQNVLPHLNQSQEKFTLPDPIIEKDTTRFIWSNFHYFNNLFGKNELPEEVRIFPLKNIFPAYIRYIYNIDLENVSCTNDELICQIRNPRSLKLKPESTIIKFFKSFYFCVNCSSSNARIVKVRSKVVQLCLKCSHRVALNEPWINEIKL